MCSVKASLSFFKHTRIILSKSYAKFPTVCCSKQTYKLGGRLQSIVPSNVLKTNKLRLLKSYPGTSSSSAQYLAFRAASTRVSANKKEETEVDDDDINDFEDLEEGEEIWDEDSQDEEDTDNAWKIETCELKWGERALDCARQVLAEIKEETGDIELYSFRISPASFKVDIRLDKLDDQFGSPSVDHLTKFSRLLNTRLEENGAPEEIWVNVSTPGAERRIRVPEELLRFQNLPMKLKYSAEEKGEEETQVKYLTFTGLPDADTSTWHLADVRANRPDGKGRKLSKKKLEAEIVIPVANIKKVNLHLDI